jgi:serine phosphatase RsbU (regulator of sigma subunit)
MNLAELILATDADGHSAQRLERVLRLVDLTRLLATEIDAERIVELVASQACEAIGCERTHVFQFDSKRNELHTRIDSGNVGGLHRCGLNHHMPGCVAHDRATVNIPDVSLDARWDSQFDLRIGSSTRGVLAVPLVAPSDETLLGVLQLVNKRNGTFDAFDEWLVEVFSRHAAAALDRARQIGRAQKALETEFALAVARNIQLSFTPRGLPEVPGYEMATWWTPNEAVGGDYCDVVPLSDKHIGLVIADVSGHGLGPSLIMASARAALRALMLEHCCPQLLLERLAQALATDLQSGHFITMLIASLDVHNHELSFTNAGHAPSEFYRAATDSFETLASTGMPLGVVADMPFPVGPTHSIACGDMVILCTDGIVEALDADDRPFGIERLQSLIRQCRGGSMKEMVECIAGSVQQHLAEDAPSDDLTILAVRRNS